MTPVVVVNNTARGAGSRKLYHVRGEPKTHWPPGEHPLVKIVEKTFQRIRLLPPEAREKRLEDAVVMLQVRTKRTPEKQWMVQYLAWAVRERLTAEGA